MRCAGPDEFAGLPLIRPADSNKGLYGHILVVAGSVGKSGAAVLAGTGALKAGAGLVTVATPDNVQSIVASNQPEYMTESLSTLADGSIAIENFARPLLRKSFLEKQFSRSVRDWDRKLAHKNSFERWCS